MNWLTEFTTWLAEQIRAFFDAFNALLQDILVFAVEAVFEVVALAVELLSTMLPEGLQGVTICGLLAQGGPTVQWAVTTFKVPEGMTVIAAAVVFRLARKLLTLFQW